VLGVAAVHLLVVDRVHGALEQPSALQAMPVVMYTRVLAQAEPPAPPPVMRAARPRVERRKAAAAALPPASAPSAEPAAVAPALPEPAPQVAAAPSSSPAPAPEPPAPEPPGLPATAGPSQADLATWPADTRLTYRLGGQFRSGPLFGDAQVQWQRDGARYQVRAEVNVKPWAHLVMTSQGEVGPDGLVPQVYEEESRGRKRRRAVFEAETVRLDNGNSVARPPLAQDTASQFVELGHRFAVGAAPLRAGEVVTVWLARPGGVDLWTYDVRGPEPLATPNMGTIDAYHLKPRPLANARGNMYAELWYAPTLQHLPVRIKLLMGEVDYIDLTIDTIEQR
jgi:hypothetical protein